MSGILGIWKSQEPSPWDKMLQDLQVWGTDGQGDWHGLDGQLSLGRTQFFDTPESLLEPAVIEYQGCVVVWDGRLDDRDSLLPNHTQSFTDGQLLIESYRRWGIDCIDRLVGEFAFILWDAANDTLCVGCDPVGGRTVAYAWNGQTLLISSRVLTLLLHPQVSRDLDPLYLAHTLCGFYEQEADSTPFKDIKRLRPGYALLLKAGQFKEQQIAAFSWPENYDSPKSARRPVQSYYDEFWDLLNKSVRDRLRTIHRPCTTLSGGLDSTTVTVSLLNQLPQIDAFSIVTSIYPEIDEREPIKAFLHQYPQTTWHEVNTDQSWALSEPWSELPIPDDPLITCTLPMNLTLMAQMQQQGFGLFFDGELGDDLCAVDFSDLVQFGRWGKAQQYLKQQERWPSFLWHELVLERLPLGLSRRWQVSKPLPVPTWIKPHYIQQPQTQAAISQHYQASIATGLQKNLSWAIGSGFSTALHRVYALMHANYKLQAVSPLQDRRIIQFAINLPPELQIDPVHEKIFLRQANQGYLPPQILSRPKNNYFDPLKYAGIAKGEQVLELLDRLPTISCLDEIIDIQQVKQTLLNYRAGYHRDRQGSYRNAEANYLYELFTFVNWYQNMVNHVF
jgi:asparagine synthase (glutamine-hydrolysing)